MKGMVFVFILRGEGGGEETIKEGGEREREKKGEG